MMTGMIMMVGVAESTRLAVALVIDSVRTTRTVRKSIDLILDSRL